MIQTIPESEIVARLREFAGPNQKVWAEANGFSRSFICDVLMGRRQVSDRLAKKLGYRLVRIFVQPEICVSCGDELGNNAECYLCIYETTKAGRGDVGDYADGTKRASRS